MSKRDTTETFIEKAKKIHGDNYDYSLVNYKFSNIEVTIICNRCGRKFEQLPYNHLRGRGCSNPIHTNKNPSFLHTTWTLERFIEKAREIHSDKYDYSLIKEYKNVDTKMPIKCNICGNIFWQSLYKHINRKQGCNVCANNIKKTKERFIEEAKKLFPEYDYSLVNYKTANLETTFICPKHGKFQRTPHRLLNGGGCPECLDYFGETLIKGYLKNHDIQFERGRTFNDLKDISELSYDFYVKEYNLLIEFNGNQHYEYSQHFHKDLHDFHRQLHHDWLKRKYARDKGFNFLVIPYWEIKKINGILEETCKKLK